MNFDKLVKQEDITSILDLDLNVNTVSIDVYAHIRLWKFSPKEVLVSSKEEWK